MSYFVYILLSNKYHKTYTGITDNIERRIKQHNLGNNLFSKRYLPWSLILTEKYCNRLEARKREKYFKTSSGRRWIKSKFFSAGVAKLVDAQS